MHGFTDLLNGLPGTSKKMGMLRITTAVVEGKIAAVDMGAVFNNTYTVVAGGHPS